MRPAKKAQNRYNTIWATSTYWVMAPVSMVTLLKKSGLQPGISARPKRVGVAGAVAGSWRARRNSGPNAISTTNSR